MFSIFLRLGCGIFQVDYMRVWYFTGGLGDVYIIMFSKEVLLFWDKVRCCRDKVTCFWDNGSVLKWGGFM